MHSIAPWHTDPANQQWQQTCASSKSHSTSHENSKTPQQHGYCKYCTAKHVLCAMAQVQTKTQCNNNTASHVSDTTPCLTLQYRAFNIHYSTAFTAQQRASVWQNCAAVQNRTTLQHNTVVHRMNVAGNLQYCTVHYPGHLDQGGEVQDRSVDVHCDMQRLLCSSVSLGTVQHSTIATRSGYCTAAQRRTLLLHHRNPIGLVC
jgi:hypothetical protein